MSTEVETQEIRFMTGTWYTMHVPVDCKLDPEELYSMYWNDELPDGIEVSEDEVDHIWE